MNRIHASLIGFAFLAPPLGLHGQGCAAEPATTPAPGTSDTRPAKPARQEPRDEEITRRDEQFRKLVTNVKLSGHFTMDAAEDQKLQKDEYVITAATKVGNGDLWALTARIKYGDVDLNVPVPVQVKWAGDTPVITVDKVGIPGLGTFSARVVIDEGRYAGTWSHDEVGGHLFGTITPAGEAAGHKEASPAATTPPKSPPATP